MEPEDAGERYAIDVRNVWKRYRTGAFSGRTLVRELQSGFARLTGKEDPNQRLTHGRGDRKSTRLNSSHVRTSRMPSSA